MTTEQLIDMLRYQDEYNTRTNGEFWYFGVANNGKPIIWELAYCAERAELINWYNWKHWVDERGCKNLGQVKIELTDMWHFVMSKMLELGYLTLVNRILSTIPGFKEPEKRDDIDIREALTKYINDNPEGFKSEREQMYREIGMAVSMEASVNEQKKALMAKAQSVDPNKKITEADFLTVLINGVIGTTNTLAYEKDKTLQTYIMQEFFLLLAMTDLVYKFGIDDLYKYYIGKIALNRLRQDNGYAESTYKKHWRLPKTEDPTVLEVLEDNDYLVKLVEAEDSALISVDGIYQKLDVEYKKQN